MSGLSLMGTGNMSAGVYAASSPSVAGSPSAATISARAYGVGSNGPNCGPRTAAYGTVITGMAGVALLLYLWWSLPR
jgi:hypothetical protein